MTSQLRSGFVCFTSTRDEGSARLVHIPSGVQHQTVARGPHGVSVRLPHMAVACGDGVLILDMLASVVKRLDTHPEAISVRFLTRTHKLAVGYRAGLVRIYDMDTGAIVFNQNTHTNKVRSICFSSDERLMVCASIDERVSVQDVSAFTHTGEEPVPAISSSTKLPFTGFYLRGHTNYVGAVAFLNKKELVLSGSNDNTVKVWALSSRACTNTLTSHRENVRSLAVRWDEEVFASSSDDTCIIIWETSTFTAVKSIPRPGSDEFSVLSLSWAYPEYLVAGVSDQGPVVFASETLEELATVLPRPEPGILYWGVDYALQSGLNVKAAVRTTTEAGLCGEAGGRAKEGSGFLFGRL
eukprot:m.768616 g.768616  ORF g.768616 m.768616 type:complete len:354 (+) comp59075_c0_seq15:1655-2716(+)